MMVKLKSVAPHLDHKSLKWTLRAVEWDGSSVRCTVWRFGLNNLTQDQAEKLATRVRQRATINTQYWKREASSPYASDMGL